MMYNKLVEECFFFPQHVGILELSEPRTVFFSNAEFSQELIAWYLQCDSNKIVKAIEFKSNGNPYMIAALEWISRQSIGKQLEHCFFNYNELIRLLEVPFTQAPSILKVQDAYMELVRLMCNQFEGKL